MKEMKLKPCPFCGREDIRAKIMNHEGYDVGIVFCINCGAQIRAFNSQAEAIEAWNRRAEIVEDENE